MLNYISALAQNVIGAHCPINLKEDHTQTDANL